MGLIVPQYIRVQVDWMLDSDYDHIDWYLGLPCIPQNITLQVHLIAFGLKAPVGNVTISLAYRIL